LVHHLAALLALLLELFERATPSSRWMMIEAEMWHDVEREDRHPRMPLPENMPNMPRMPPACERKILPQLGSMLAAVYRSRTGRPERTGREPDALLELLGLGKRREIEIGRKLFCC
jgi:hypothetical protein